MNPLIRWNNRDAQRGEGKVGCTISAVVMLLLCLIGIKVVPAYYADNQISDIVDRKVESAAGRTPEDLVKEIRIEIRSLDVPEASREGAITVKKIMNANEGRAVGTLHYTHKVDLYGITQWTITVDKTIEHPVLENIK